MEIKYKITGWEELQKDSDNVTRLAEELRLAIQKLNETTLTIQTENVNTGFLSTPIDVAILKEN